jgi:hypothetical protein
MKLNLRWGGMKTVKYCCKRCGHSEELTTAESILYGLIYGVVLLLIACGVLLIWLIATVGLNPFVTVITQGQYLAANRANDAQLRELALNMTEECSGDNADCYARGVFEGTKNLKYVPDSINGNHNYDAMYVWTHGRGDCKSLANLYRALMNSIGFKAEMSCDVGYRHCVAVVPRSAYGERYQGYFVVDLTAPEVVQMEDNMTIWSYEMQGHRMEW